MEDAGGEDDARRQIQYYRGIDAEVRRQGLPEIIRQEATTAEQIGKREKSGRDPVGHMIADRRKTGRESQKEQRPDYLKEIVSTHVPTVPPVSYEQLAQTGVG